MKKIFTLKKIVILLILVLVSGSAGGGCAGTKDAQERRNLMIPKKDELPRNKKYTSVTKRKTNKIKTTKHKKPKKYH